MQYTHLNFHERNASSFWQEINPSSHSCVNVKKLLELHATYEHWEKVINLSSRAVLHLNKDKYRTDFYYIWITALYETHEYFALEILAKHLLLMGTDYPTFYCLAAIAYNYSGKRTESAKILKNQKNYLNIKTRYYREALGLHLSSSNNKKYIKRGIILLKNICAETHSDYFTWRNCLRVLSDHNLEHSMSRFYNLMQLKFPYAHEPYLVASLIAIDEENWSEAIRLLKQILLDNPHNKDAILALSHCYEMSRNINMAYQLMRENKHFYHGQDYDFNLSWAKLLEHEARNKNDKDACENAILYYDRAISLAKFFKFPVEQLKDSRNHLTSLNRKLKNKNDLLISLESFLEQKDRADITTISSLYKDGQSVKINFK